MSKEGNVMGQPADMRRTDAGHSPTAQEQVEAYNLAIDQITLWQKQAQQLQIEMIVSRIPLCTSVDNPHHVKLSKEG
jgi:hypothetical protein